MTLNPMIGNYEDLLELIGVNENIYNNCRKSYREIERFLLNLGMPAGYPEGTSYLDADSIHGGKKELHSDHLQQLVDEMRKLESMIFLQESILESLYAARKNYLRKLKGLTGIDYKIVYKRDLEKKSLQQIADELGYSLDRVKQLSAKNKR